MVMKYANTFSTTTGMNASTVMEYQTIPFSNGNIRFLKAEADQTVSKTPRFPVSVATQPKGQEHRKNGSKTLAGKKW